MGKTVKLGRTDALFRETLVVGLLLVILAACRTSDSAQEPVATPWPTRTLLPATPTPTALPVTQTPVPTNLPDPAALMAQIPQADAGESLANLPADALASIDRATADLAAELDVSAADIHLIGLEAFQWTDATWGCTGLQGDEQFSRDATSGYRIILEHNDQITVYHAGTSNEVVQCPDRNWLAQVGRPIPLDPIAESIVAQAQQDAGRRLSLDPEQVRAVSVLTVNWPDSSLGCPKPGIEYDAIPTRGYRLVFEAGAAQLIYHTSIQRVIPCTTGEEILPGALRQALPMATPEPTPNT